MLHRLTRRFAGRRTIWNGSEAALAALLLASACGSSLNAIVEPRILPPASAAPQVMSITDLGEEEIPSDGLLRAHSGDGVAVIGEALWVQGTDFGREPSVSIAGRQVAVLARTGDGGLVVRVPPGTPAGSQSLLVSNEQGAGQRHVTVRRYVVMIPQQGGALAWAELGGGGPAAPGWMPLDSELLALTPDGRAAYVSSARAGRLTVINLAAAGIPAAERTIEIGGARAVVLAAAAAANVVAFVRDEDLVLVDAANPLSPVPGTPWRLPDVVREDRVRSAVLSPDGRLLAVAGATSNRVHLVELTAGEGAQLVASAVVADEDPGQLRQVLFSQDGRTVWVAAADARHPLGDWVPVQLHAAHVTGEPGGRFGLEIVHGLTAGPATEPVSMCLARSGFTTGSVAWLPPQSTTLFLAAAVREQQRSAFFRVDSSAVVELATSKARLGEVALSSDGRWLLAPARRADGATAVLAVAVEENAPPAIDLLVLPPPGAAANADSGTARIGIQP